MVPLSALLAIVIVAQRTGRTGAVLACLVAFAFLALTVDVNLSPRLQRGDWNGVAQVLNEGTGARAITTVELAPRRLSTTCPGWEILRAAPA